MARISVIIPCYNACAFLGKTIESVLAQDAQDWELILVDDGSTDATPEIIQRYCGKDARIHGVRQENGRQAKARNLGVAHSAPDSVYFFFLDSDDLLLPHALRQMSDYLDTHPEVGLLACQFQEIDPQDRPYGNMKRSRWVPGWFFPRQLSDDEHETPFVAFYCSTGQGPFALYRKSVYEKTAGWDTEIVYVHEDTDIFCQMALFAPVHYMPDRLYLKRVHGASLTQNNDKIQAAYAQFRQKWDNYQSTDPRQQEMLRAAKRHYHTRHKPFRDLKVALQTVAIFCREPSMHHVKWALFLFKCGIKGLFSPDRF